MALTQDQLFEFDVQGYLHLRNALTPAEVVEYTAWMDEAQSTDVQALNADFPEGLKQQLNRPVSRMVDAAYASFRHPALLSSS